MSQLAIIIQSLPDWETKTAEAIAAELAAVVPLSDPTPYTFARLGEVLGQNAAAVVADTMARVGLGELALPPGFARMRGLIQAAFTAMSATAEGISLHTDDRQQLIALLGSLGEPAEQWPPELTAAVAGLGRRTQSRFKELGGVGPLPSAQAVTAALRAIEVELIKTALRIERANVYNAQIEAIDNWTGDGNPPSF